MLIAEPALRRLAERRLRAFGMSRSKATTAASLLPRRALVRLVPTHTLLLEVIRGRRARNQISE